MSRLQEWQAGSCNVSRCTIHHAVGTCVQQMHPTSPSLQAEARQSGRAWCLAHEKLKELNDTFGKRDMAARPLPGPPGPPGMGGLPGPPGPPPREPNGSLPAARWAVMQQLAWQPDLMQGVSACRCWRGLSPGAARRLEQGQLLVLGCPVPAVLAWSCLTQQCKGRALRLACMPRWPPGTHRQLFL